MGWFDNDSDEGTRNGKYHVLRPSSLLTTAKVTSGTVPNQASWTHELIAGAASYEAAKAYENHVAANGQPATHAEAKEILAGFAGAFVDREVETKGLDFIDKEKAKREASQRAQAGLADSGDYN